MVPAYGSGRQYMAFDGKGGCLLTVYDQNVSQRGGRPSSRDSSARETRAPSHHDDKAIRNDNRRAGYDGGYQFGGVGSVESRSRSMGCPNELTAVRKWKCVC